jgi:uridine phosphorylase
VFHTGGRPPLSTLRRLPVQHEIRPVHLKPSAGLAERVLLPDDPHRALAVAPHLLEGPRMFNHHRGLWGYTGVASDGEPLTIQSTGMGGPSAAIVVEELVALGAHRLVRIGTCGALVAGLDLGAVVAVERALPNDGASAALGANGSVSGSHALLERLVATGARAATVVSTDLFYDRRGDEAAGWVEQGAIAVEMETAAIFQVASRRGAEAACVLGITADPDEHRATPEQVETIGLRVGDAGYAALRTL